jgi:hypothetical protein
MTSPQSDLLPWERQPPRAYEVCPGWPAGDGVYRYRVECLGVAYERVSATPLIAALIGPERGRRPRKCRLVVLAWSAHLAETDDAVASAAKTGGFLCIKPTERRRETPTQESSTLTQHFADP